MRESEQFGQDWRGTRFGNAVMRNIAVERDYNRYQQSRYESPQIEEEYAEAKRTITVGLYHLYLDILDAHDPQEIERAEATFDLLRNLDQYDVVDNGLLIVKDAA